MIIFKTSKVELVGCVLIAVKQSRERKEIESFLGEIKNLSVLGNVNFLQMFRFSVPTRLT